MSFSFIKIPRTGSNSVCETLGLQKDHWSYRKTPPSDFMFAFFRHPADRLVSWWEFHRRYQTSWKQYRVTFPAWLHNGCPIHHDKSISDVGNSLNQYEFICDEVTLYDFAKIADEWPKICKRIGVDLPLKHLVASERKPWEEYYNRDTYKIVKDLFSVDWKIYEKINPAFVKYSDMHFA